MKPLKQDPRVNSCKQLRADFEQQLCALNPDQLSEIGAWHGSVQSVVNELVAKIGCDSYTPVRTDLR